MVVKYTTEIRLYRLAVNRGGGRMFVPPLLPQDIPWERPTLPGACDLGLK